MTTKRKSMTSRKKSTTSTKRNTNFTGLWDLGGFSDPERHISFAIIQEGGTSLEGIAIVTGTLSRVARLTGTGSRFNVEVSFSNSSARPPISGHFISEKILGGVFFGTLSFSDGDQSLEKEAALIQR